jgi:hypothetical protein
MMSIKPEGLRLKKDEIVKKDEVNTIGDSDISGAHSSISESLKGEPV